MTEITDETPYPKGVPDWNGPIGAYTITFTFVSTDVALAGSPVTPEQFVDSGQNLKYPRVPSTALPATYNPLLLAKTADTDLGGPDAFDTTYTLTVTNLAPYIVGLPNTSEFSRWVDTLPAGVDYIEGSAKITDSTPGDADTCGITTTNFALGDPEQVTLASGETVLTWTHPFAVPSHGTCMLTFRATIPPMPPEATTPKTYENCTSVWNFNTQTGPACWDVTSLPAPQPGTITIVKNTIPTDFDGTFGFTAEGPGAHVATDTITTEHGGGVVILTDQPSGTYTISESTVPDFWELVKTGGTCTNSDGTETQQNPESGTITAELPEGGSMTCRFSNRRETRKLTVTKKLVPGAGLTSDPGQFIMVAGSGTNTVPGTAGGDGADVSTSVYVGASTGALEIAGDLATSLANYDISIRCDDPAQSSKDGNVLQFIMPDQALVKCTITNTRKTFGVTLTKAWSGGTPDDRVESAIGGDLLTDPREGWSLNGGAPSPATATAAAGSRVTVAESFAQGSGYTSTLECTRDSDHSPIAAVDGTTGEFTMPSDSAVTCIFTNAKITVDKEPASLTPVGAGQPPCST